MSNIEMSLIFGKNGNAALLLAIAAAILLPGCKSPPAISEQETIVVNIVQALAGQKTDVLEASWDWPALYENLKQRGDLARDLPSEEVHEQMLKGMKIALAPAKGHVPVFHTRLKCAEENLCRVFLYDGELGDGDNVNLFFELTRKGNQWQVTYTDFYVYFRWVLRAPPAMREEYRKRLLAEYE